MMIYKSRFTPNLKNGEDVHFEIGETVTYQTRNGDTFRIKIDSDMMENSGYYGYEAIFSDDGEHYFAVAKGIIDWDGKC